MERKLRNIAVLALSAIFLLAFAACGDSNNIDNIEPESTPQAVEPESITEYALTINSADDLEVLLMAHHGRLPGGSAGDEDIHPVLLLERHKVPECLFVHVSVPVEGGDECCTGSCKHVQASPKCSLRMRRVRVLRMLS